MAEQLDDGEFWLPPQFLTDDDILEDFSPPISNSGSFGFGSSSDLNSLTGSTETESSDDDEHLLSGLSRSSLLRCPIHSKVLSVLSSSPQSTLCGCMCNNQGSTRGSGTPNGPVSPPKEEKKENEKENDNATLDLLNKAAGEVAKMKLRSEQRSAGTGFFDCSNSAKGLLCPPPLPAQPPLNQVTPQYPPYFIHPFQLRPFPPAMWTPASFLQHQNRVVPPNSNNNTNNKINNGARPLGLPPSAWPPLPGQPQAQAQPQAPAQPAVGMFMPQPGQKRESVGTGVFLPRRVANANEFRKKSDGSPMKTKNNKGSQRRNSSKSAAAAPDCRQSTVNSTAKDDELKLPTEWTY